MSKQRNSMMQIKSKEKMRKKHKGKKIKNLLFQQLNKMKEDWRTKRY
jgi:hypothetical protein